MKEIKVSLNDMNKVKDFVSVAQKYPCEIDLVRDRYCVDAKSLLGVFSLDLSQPITCRVHDDNNKELLNVIKAFKA